MPNSRSYMALAMIALAPLLIYFNSVAIAAIRQVELTTKYKLYEIGGSTAVELYSQMENNGPWADEVWGTKQPGRVWALIEVLPDISKKNVYAKKCSNNTGKYKTTCVLRLDDFTLQSLITLPKWSPPANAGPMLRSTWSLLFAAMKKEAIRHRNIAYGKMKKLRRDLNSPLKKAPLTGFHATVKHNAVKAASPSSETMRMI